MRTSIQEAQWVLRAQADDREALELLLGGVRMSLRRYLCSVVGADDAEDVLQDVLVLIYRKLAWLEDPTLFRPWAFRIASRAAFRMLKQRKRQHDRESTDTEIDSIAAPVERPSDELVRQLHVIAEISPASRAVLVLHFAEDLPLSDVAAILEIPLGTVKSRLAYGLAAIRKQLEHGRRL